MGSILVTYSANWILFTLSGVNFSCLNRASVALCLVICLLFHRVLVGGVYFLDKWKNSGSDSKKVTRFSDFVRCSALPFWGSSGTHPTYSWEESLGDFLILISSIFVLHIFDLDLGGTLFRRKRRNTYGCGATWCYIVVFLFGIYILGVFVKKSDGGRFFRRISALPIWE